MEKYCVLTKVLLYAGCYETEKGFEGADKKRYQAEKGCDSAGKKTFSASLCRLPVEYAFRHNLSRIMAFSRERELHFYGERKPLNTEQRAFLPKADAAFL